LNGRKISIQGALNKDQKAGKPRRKRSDAKTFVIPRKANVSRTADHAVCKKERLKEWGER